MISYKDADGNYIYTRLAEVLNDDQRVLFVEGWKAAGGYMGDTDSDTPWCAPWTYGGWIPVDMVDDARLWGAMYWEQVADEVECCLEIER